MNFYEKIRTDFLEPAGLINKELTKGCEISCGGARIDFHPEYHTICKIKGTPHIETTEFGPMKITKVYGHEYDLREVISFFCEKSEDMLEQIIVDIMSVVNMRKSFRDQDLEPLYNLMKSL